ncbi:MAG: hypothetical protein WCD12_15920 [Candidatus Binatus sp.]|uniref:hypothetical protein n=1 Tax=Candidatus Binatus sp. TaxID=2811406 RepID=UPI003C76208A
MNLNYRSMKGASSLLSVLLAGLLLVSCSQTTPPAPNQAVQAPIGQAPPPPMASVQPPQIAVGGQYEEPPIVNVADLMPGTPLSGQGFSVQPQAPTNGAMGQYTIVADPSVFHDDAGTYYVESLDMLKIRLSEIPAIVQLDGMSNSSVFAQALASSALRPVNAAANMVMHPMDTVTGLPGGVGDLFGRVSLGAGQIASSAANSFGSGKAAGQAGNATLTALGYDQVRRQLAHELHVDPYSSDPILTKKLNHVAWVMFSARMTVSAAMMAVPGSIIITAVTVTNDLVYQTPRADLIILVQKKLKSFGLSQEEIVTFSTNTAIPLSVQVDAVKELEALGHIPGRHAAAVAIGNVMTEYQARFLVTSLHMLNQWGQRQAPIAAIQAPGVLVANDQNGATILPAPVDYLSWTQRIAGFATDPQLLGMQNRVLLITGGMTPLARQQLGDKGWNVQSAQQ